MTTQEVDTLLNQNSPFIAKKNPSKEEYIFRDSTFFINGTPLSNYEIIEDAERFNIKFPDSAVFPPKNYKIKLDEFIKDVILNYNKRNIEERTLRDEGSEFGYFILIPKPQIQTDETD